MNSESTCVFCQRLEQRRPGKSLQIRRCPLCDGELLHDRRNGTSYRIDARPKQQSIAKRVICGGLTALVVIVAAVGLLHFTQPKPIYVTLKTAKVEKKIVRVGLLPFPKAALRIANDSVPLAKAKQAAAIVSVRKPLDSAIRTRIRMESVPPVRYLTAKLAIARESISRNKPIYPAAKKTLKAVSDTIWEKRLLETPEIGLDNGLHKKLFQEVAAQQKNNVSSDKAIEAGKKIRKKLLAENADWKHMPWLEGAACQIKPAQATVLGAVSRDMRNRLALIARTKNQSKKKELVMAAFHISPDALSFRDSAKIEEQQELAIPAFHQIYMAEPVAYRQIFVNYAGSFPSKTALDVLAKRALFDSNEKVRRSALANLYYIATKHEKLTTLHPDVLVQGIKYPIPEISTNAMNALVQLGDTSVIPKLIEILDDSDPTKPFAKIHKRKKQLFRREVVRLNHNRNCLVCHAPMGVAGNAVPGIIPSIDKPLPPPTEAYYGILRSRRGGIFVRADITYLRQQFSVMLPVKDHGKWPKMQRFDFLVRERPATKTEVLAWEKERNMKSVNPYRQRILHVLEQLTGLELAANQKATRAAVAEWRRQMTIVDRNAKGR